MRTSNKVIFKIISVIAALFILSGCAAKSTDSAGNYELATEDSSSDSGNYNQAYEEEKGESPEEYAYEGNKIITTYFTYIETLDFEESNKELTDLIIKHEAYIEDSNVSNRGYEYGKSFKYGSFSIRIPKENIDSFRSRLKELGNITEESSTKEDVTKYYRDTQSRLELVTSKEKRLLALLENAEIIEDIIAIESELTNTIYEKEILQGDLKSMDDKIDYSTVNLELIEVRNYSNVDKVDSTLGKRINTAFSDSLFSFKVAVENFIIWFVFALPYILISVPLIALAVVLIKKRKDKTPKIK